MLCSGSCCSRGFKQRRIASGAEVHTSPQRTGSEAHTRRITEPSREGSTWTWAGPGRPSGARCFAPFWNRLPSSPTKPAQHETHQSRTSPSPSPSASLAPAAARRLGSHPRRSYHGQPSSSLPFPSPPFNLRVALPMHAPAVGNHPGFVLNLLLSSVRLVGLRGAAIRGCFAPVGDRLPFARFRVRWVADCLLPVRIAGVLGVMWAGSAMGRNGIFGTFLGRRI